MNNMQILENKISIKSSAKDYEYENIKNIGDEIVYNLKCKENII